MISQDHVGDSQISHHTGALSSASLDQMTVLRAVVRLIRLNQTAKTKTPVFHDLFTIWNSEMTARAQAMKFAIGTSGYVGSITPTRRQGRTSSVLKYRQSQGNQRARLNRYAWQAIYISEMPKFTPISS